MLKPNEEKIHHINEHKIFVIINRTSKNIDPVVRSEAGKIIMELNECTG